MTAIWASAGVSVVLFGNAFTGPRLEAFGGLGAELLATTLAATAAVGVR
jgi:hypothetical protein